MFRIKTAKGYIGRETNVNRFGRECDGKLRFVSHKLFATVYRGEQEAMRDVRLLGIDVSKERVAIETLFDPQKLAA